MPLLRNRDCQCRGAKGPRTARFHLNKRESFTIARDQIDFPEATAVIALDNAIALLVQKSDSGLLSCTTDRLPLLSHADPPSASHLGMSCGEWHLGRAHGEREDAPRCHSPYAGRTHSRATWRRVSPSAGLASPWPRLRRPQSTLRLGRHARPLVGCSAMAPHHSQR